MGGGGAGRGVEISRPGHRPRAPGGPNDATRRRWAAKTTFPQLEKRRTGGPLSALLSCRLQRFVLVSSPLAASQVAFATNNTPAGQSAGRRSLPPSRLTSGRRFSQEEAPSSDRPCKKISPPQEALARPTPLPSGHSQAAGSLYLPHEGRATQRRRTSPVSRRGQEGQSSAGRFPQALTSLASSRATVSP